MWLINTSNSNSIFSVLLCFLLVRHTPIHSQTQFIAPTFRSSSRDDVRYSTASICVWLSYSFISNVIERLTTPGMFEPSFRPSLWKWTNNTGSGNGPVVWYACSRTIGQTVLQLGCGLEIEPGCWWMLSVWLLSSSPNVSDSGRRGRSSVGTSGYDWSLVHWDWIWVSPWELP